MAFLGFLTILSLVSIEHGSLTSWWIGILYQIAGWGAIFLPIGFIAIGGWLILRDVERLREISSQRLVGIILLFINLLTWFHLFAGGGWGKANLGQGGGYLGAFFERILVIGVGEAGALVALIAWLLIGMVFTVDLSIPELIQKCRSLIIDLRNTIEQQKDKQQAKATSQRKRLLPTPHTSEELPPTCQKLSPDTRKLSRNAHPASINGKSVTTAQSRSKPPVPIESKPRSKPTSSTKEAVWAVPSIESILDPTTPVAIQENLVRERAKLIEETLASFGAPSHVVEIHRGPTITQFGVEPDYIETRSGRTRVRVNKISVLADDLALALAAPRIRIQAPVPGRSYIGIEVPNIEISRVSLRELMENKKFRHLQSPLRIALGKDVAGKSKVVDLISMPHLLIAGTTGSGKSVCINSILCCLLLNNSPEDLRLILVDPKRVELTGYNGLPHLLAPVVVNADRVISALQWMGREMDSRYHKFAQDGVRSIEEYNLNRSDERLPYLVVVIDELADLMMLAPDETERSVTRLTQLARATGIHLIIATQRPSVNIVTGLIKANFPARVAFAVASSVDSRVIIDQPGAERLLGRGDMLYQGPDSSSPVRLQGAFVSDHEIKRLVDYWRSAAAKINQGSSATDQVQIKDMPSSATLHQAPLWEDGKQMDKDDPLLTEAIDLVRRQGRASITMLQRRLRIGYTRAARLVDTMEDKKIISPVLPHSQFREVLDYGDAAPPADD